MSSNDPYNRGFFMFSRGIVMLHSLEMIAFIKICLRAVKLKSIN